MPCIGAASALPVCRSEVFLFLWEHFYNVILVRTLFQILIQCVFVCTVSAIPLFLAMYFFTLMNSGAMLMLKIASVGI